MVKARTAHKDPSKGIFREPEKIEPAQSLFRRTSGAGGTERYRVSAADSPEELRAERTADRVMGGGSIFRESSGPGAAGGMADVPSADLAGPGSTLPLGLERSMGASIGADFSGVRVHTGPGADRASRSLSARAFTRGRDLYFRSGEYNPGSREGQRLIAHELAHVAQGVQGLHRAYTRQAFPSDKDGRPDFDAIKTNIGAICNAVEIVNDIEGKTLAKFKEDYMATLEKQENTITSLNEAEAAIGDAESYITALEDRINSGALSSEDKETLEKEKKRLEDLGVKMEQIDRLRARIRPEGESADASMPDIVKDMLNSPYAEQFFRAADQIRKAGAEADFTEKEEKAGGKAKAKKSKLSAEKKRGYIQHQNELRKVDNGGLEKVEEGSTWMGTLGERLNAVGGSVGKVSESVGGMVRADRTVKEHGKSGYKEGTKEERDAVDKKIEKQGKAASGITKGAGELFSGLGAGLSSIQNSKDMSNRNKQGARAEQSMKETAKRLKETIPTQFPPEQNRLERIRQVCERVENRRAKASAVSLTQLISDAMDNDGDVKPALTVRQKGLLAALQALETGRASSERQAKQLKQDMIFNGLKSLGALAKSAGDITTGLGSLLGGQAAGIAGAACTLFGSLIEQAGAAGKQIWGGKMEGDEGEEKMEACRAAIQQMAELPPIDSKVWEELKGRADGNGQQEKVPVLEMACAEQYAVAFHTIESANVNMSDFLFAIEKGEFGKKGADGREKSVAASLEDLYQNLSFS